MAGTDEGAIWTFTEGCIILVLCPPYWAIYLFHPSKETHFCLFYQDFILSVSHVLSAARLLLSRCAYRGHGMHLSLGRIVGIVKEAGQRAQTWLSQQQAATPRALALDEQYSSQRG